MSFWEDFCIQVVKNVLPLLPRVVNDGFHEFGLDIAPCKDVALPSLSDYDTDAPLEGFCGLGTKDLGTAVLDLTGSRLNGLDTIAQTPGQPITFTKADEVMLIPLTITKLTLDSQFEIRRRCQPQSGPEYLASAKGSLRGTIENAKVAMTISGLDQDKGRAGAVLLAWSSPKELPALSFGDPVFTQDTKDSARRTVKNYLSVARKAKKLEATLVDQLTGILTGSISLGSRTLPGTLLEVINGAFAQI